jgi:hypothetical protein
LPGTPRTDPDVQFFRIRFLGYTRLRDGCMILLYNRFAIALSEVCSHSSSSTLAGMSYLCGLRTSVSAFPKYVAFPRSEYYA